MESAVRDADVWDTSGVIAPPAPQLGNAIAPRVTIEKQNFTFIEGRPVDGV